MNRMRWQPRHLLGLLLFFFAERWADAANTLEPVLGAGIRAVELPVRAFDRPPIEPAKRTGTKEPRLNSSRLARARLNSICSWGKAHLILRQYDLALADFQAAEQANPNLTFVHFNLA